MKTIEKAIETTATIIEEGEWLRGGNNTPAFHFLKALEEDIYSLADGRPFHDQG